MRKANFDLIIDIVGALALVMIPYFSRTIKDAFDEYEKEC